MDRLLSRVLEAISCRALRPGFSDDRYDGEVPNLAEAHSSLAERLGFVGPWRASSETLHEYMGMELCSDVGIFEVSSEFHSQSCPDDLTFIGFLSEEAALAIHFFCSRPSKPIQLPRPLEPKHCSLSETFKNHLPAPTSPAFPDPFQIYTPLHSTLNLQPRVHCLSTVGVLGSPA